METDNPIIRYVYITMAAIGGSIVYLSQQKWQSMPWPDRGMTLAVGILFSIFGVPWLVGDLMKVDIQPLRVACGITFFGAAAAPTAMPRILKFLREKFATQGEIK